jgi:hypothetical protein
LLALGADADSTCHLYVAGSFLDKVPEADIFVLRMVLHDWNDQQSALILKNIRFDSMLLVCVDVRSLMANRTAVARRDRMRPHSRLVVIENVMPAEGEHSNLIPLSVEVQDLHMMVMLDGKERTGQQFEKLFDDVGLTLMSSTPTRGIYHIMESRLKQ